MVALNFALVTYNLGLHTRLLQELGTFKPQVKTLSLLSIIIIPYFFKKVKESIFIFFKMNLKEKKFL